MEATLTIGQVAHKLPEVAALIAEAQAMRAWLTAAAGCRCDTFDVCALFATAAAAAGPVGPGCAQPQSG